MKKWSRTGAVPAQLEVSRYRVYQVVEVTRILRGSRQERSIMQNGIEPQLLNSIIQGDCIKSLAQLPEGCVDLAFADPPFNIGYEYDVYQDKKGRDEYLGWTRKWIGQVFRVLKPSGTFWLAIGDEYAAEVKVLCQDLGFTTRSWVIWYYTFGVNCTRKFTRSHAHLFYFVKDPNEFTFRDDDLENRIPSARQLVYNDGRANPRGRLPDDTWILRPQDLVDCFTPLEDTWYFPRVAGTFYERAGFHGCQMPEQLLGRIIRMCSHPGDLVVDPFSGSATTLAVARKLGRKFIGFELSPEYVKRGLERTKSVRPGDPLVGAPEPLVSAPATPISARAGVKKKSPSLPPQTENGYDPEVVRAREHLIRAYESVYDGYSLDRVLTDPALAAELARKCHEMGLPGTPKDWNHLLMRLRKAGSLRFPVTKRTEFSWSEYDEFLFASEIAWSEMGEHGTLDHILCDPDLAQAFDRKAQNLAPGFTPLQYRWGALTLRKTSKTARLRSEFFATLSVDQFESDRRLRSWKDDVESLNSPGLYLVQGDSRQKINYVGSALNLLKRLSTQFAAGQLDHWEQERDAKFIRFLPQPETTAPLDLLSMQKRLIQLAKPRWNLGPTAA
jgi:site-specific DNA-methyltransferase (adenine-specific)